MLWAWRRINDKQWRLDDTWTVEQHAGRWYAGRNGAACLVDWEDINAAFKEAETLREKDKLYAQ